MSQTIIDDYVLSAIRMVTEDSPDEYTQNQMIPPGDEELIDSAFYDCAVKRIRTRIEESVGLYLPDVVNQLYEEFTETGTYGGVYQRIGECSLLALDDICEKLYEDFLI